MSTPDYKNGLLQGYGLAIEHAAKCARDAAQKIAASQSLGEPKTRAEIAFAITMFADELEIATTKHLLNIMSSGEG